MFSLWNASVCMPLVVVSNTVGISSIFLSGVWMYLHYWVNGLEKEEVLRMRLIFYHGKSTTSRHSVTNQLDAHNLSFRGRSTFSVPYPYFLPHFV